MYNLLKLLYYIYMKSNDLFNLLHNAVEAQNFGRKISQKEMAQRLNVSMRTYQDWKLGRTNPQAAIAIFKMLSELEDEDIVRVVKKVSKVLKNDKYNNQRE